MWDVNYQLEGNYNISFSLPFSITKCLNLQFFAKFASSELSKNMVHAEQHAIRYHNSQAVVISALQVAKHPFITPGPSSVFTPPPTRHSTLPGVAQGVLAGITMTGSLPYYASGGAGEKSTGGLRYSSIYGGGDNGVGSVSSSGYPTPRPGSAASGFDMASFYMGSPQIGGSHASNLFRSFPRPHSSPKMKLRLILTTTIIFHSSMCSR